MVVVVVVVEERVRGWAVVMGQGPAPVTRIRDAVETGLQGGVPVLAELGEQALQVAVPKTHVDVDQGHES